MPLSTPDKAAPAVHQPEAIDWATFPLRQSTVQGYAQCGEAFRLEHIYGVADWTWWATLAGSAIHELTELYDRRDILKQDVTHIPTFEECFDTWIDLEGPMASEIKANGKRVLKESWDGGAENTKRDRDWWYRWGPRFVDAYLRWRETNTMKLFAVELNFTVNLGKGGPITGTMDRVYFTDNGVLIVDLKTGYREPPGPLQLAVYREGLWLTKGLLADRGAFGKFRWDKDAEEVEFYLDEVDIRHNGLLSSERIEERYRQARAGMVNGIFIANPTNACRNTCGFYEMCWAQGGKYADQFPVERSV